LKTNNDILSQKKENKSIKKTKTLQDKKKIKTELKGVVVVENNNIKENIEVIEDEQVGGKLRYFKLFYNEEYQGRYCGRKPKQAANKAYSSIIKEMKKNGNQKGGINVDINFSIRECTRNSKHKEYKYIGLREELKVPVEVKIKNEDGSVKVITYSFYNKISKAPKI
jgi:hypothetical protein